MGKAGHGGRGARRGGAIATTPGAGAAQPSLFDDAPAPPAQPAPDEAPVAEPLPSAPHGLAQVLIDRQARSLDRAFTYRVPERLAGKVQVGSYVLAPFGKDRVPGFVIGLTEEAPQAQLKDITSLLVDAPLFSEAEVELSHAIADDCCCGLLEALRCFLPPGSARRAGRRLKLAIPGDHAETVRHAPKQAAALKFITDAGGECDFEALARRVGRDSAPAAVAALVEKGIVTETRSLNRPAAQERSERVVTLSETEVDWDAELENLRAKAPRQAEIIEELIEADGEELPTAGLNAAAIQALAEKGYVLISQRRVERHPDDDDGLRPDEPESVHLTKSQDRIYRRAMAALDARRHEGFLLYGITGSGKTEVYLHSIEAARKHNRGAIVLVPEISLTPQMVGRFRARFGDRLALLHSALSPGERFDEWERIRRGDADIVVGARSAVFAPVRDLGVIVIDEEHDRAYKQEGNPRYDARDIAQQRARASNAVLILGSATPTIETYYHAVCEPEGTHRPHHRDLQLVTLDARIDDRPMPEVTLIDLRREPPSERGGHLSDTLMDALGERLAAGEQAILFLNRRGFSTYVMCRECGEALRCPDCAVALTYHHRTRLLRCHHCDYSRPVPNECDSCHGHDVGFHGVGTERVADQIERLFPEARIARMDRDTVARKGMHGDILRRFQTGEANVLVGTQMIAKGLHFPNVTLVGVLNADTGLNRPDFRAAEHTFQLLTQVSGRAGRAEKPGHVYVQTYNPDNYAIRAAANHDFTGFYEQEIAFRRETLYPPFSRLVNVIFSDEHQEAALHAADLAAAVLKQAGLAEKAGLPTFLGPSECPLHKLRGKWRYHIVLKGADIGNLRTVIGEALYRLGEARTTNITIDVDPVDMM